MIVAIGANTSCTSINSLMSMNSIIKNIPVLNQTLLNIDCDPPILFFSYSISIYQNSVIKRVNTFTI